MTTYHNGQLTDKAKIAIIPLPGDLNTLAQKGELVVDHENHKVYITDYNDASVKHDITNWIAENLGRIDGDIIEVEIEGLGVVNLKEFLSSLNLQVQTRTIEAKNVTGTSYYFGNQINEQLFTKNVKGEMEIGGFSDAPNNTILVKRDGKIKYIIAPNFDGSGGGSGGGGNTGGGLDGAYTGEVFELTVMNGNLFPSVSMTQVANQIGGNVNITLPGVETEYAKLSIMINTSKVDLLTVTYTNNVFLEENYENAFQINSNYYLEFMTFNKGTTWFASKKIYNRRY